MEEIRSKQPSIARGILEEEEEGGRREVGGGRREGAKDLCCLMAALGIGKSQVEENRADTG